MIRDFEDAAATTMFTFLIGQRGVCGVANHDIRIMSGMETVVYTDDGLLRSLSCGNMSV